MTYVSQLRLFMRIGICFAISMMFGSSLSLDAIAESPKEWLDSNLKPMAEFYRELHQSPELSFEEEKTAARLAKELRAVGVDVTEKVGGHGVVGVLKNGEGKTVMLRADMDGLPIVEETGLDYASKVKLEDKLGATVGVMHACGHDVHMTNLISVAKYLSKNKDTWQGTIVFICQPAEERGSGARAMLNDGLFQRFPRPDFGLAFHVTSILPAGKIGYKSGYAMANVDSVDISFQGRGGHGAAPHTTIDPIVMAARFVLDLQTLISRENKAIEPAVITVGAIRGGTKHNIIPDTCDLQITVRSYTADVREKLIEGIKRKAKASAASSNAPEPKIKVSEGTPALFNDEKLVARLIPVFEKTLGKENVIAGEAVMGGEDFSQYGLAGTPVFMYWVGSMEPERLSSEIKKIGQAPSLHTAGYYPDIELTLPVSVQTMAAAVQELLPVKQKE